MSMNAKILEKPPGFKLILVYKIMKFTAFWSRNANWARGRGRNGFLIGFVAGVRGGCV